MTFGEIVNYALYALSGFCFGIFASRYSVLTALHIKRQYAVEGLACVFSSLPQLLFLIAAFFLFPTWFTSKTTIGGFIYYAVLLFFFSRGLRIYKNS